jgi:hypothetical protein
MVEPLDFQGLRAEIEEVTRLPEFGAVERRARRLRTRDRLAVVGALLGTLVVIAPVGLTALNARQQGTTTAFDPDRQLAPLGLISPEHPDTRIPDAQVPLTLDIRTKAVDGIDIDALWAALDVCAEANSPSPTTRNGAQYAVAECSLQVTRVLTEGQVTPVVVGELRDQGTQTLNDIQLVALSDRSLLLSGVPEGQDRQYLKVVVTGGGERPTAPTGKPGEPGRDDRIVQLAAHGEIYAVHQADDQFLRLARQPDLSQPTAVTSVAPTSGWWVTGQDPMTGAVAVSVSRDQGRSWTTRGLGLMPGIETPTLVTRDGRVAYVFVHTATGIAQYRTVDAGATWVNVPMTTRWPTSGDASGRAPTGADPRRFGAVVRPDGAVLAWLEDTPAPVYLLSTDQGKTYRSAAGPAGRVVPVPGGYVSISDRLLVSDNAETWTPLPAPGHLPPR